MARTIDKDKLITSLAWYEQQGMISSIDDILDIIDDFPTLTPPNEWVSVEERLPEESDGMVLLTDGISVRTGYRNWMFRMDDYPIVFVPGQKKGGGEMAVTHWMKISAPPNRRLPEGEGNA